jgi:hypothetical protein
MFKAIVLACSISNPNVCIEFEDTREQLITKEQCVQRTFEMRNDISEMMTDMKAVAYRCTQLKEGRFT